MSITVDEFLLFCDRTIDAMGSKISKLDDQEVILRPPAAGANSPFGLVTHALGACRWWTETAICGHQSARDRDTEFIATGSTSELLELCVETKRVLRALGQELAAADHLACEVSTQTPLGQPWTVGAALLHAYEELAQHCGHLEITVDWLMCERPETEAQAGSDGLGQPLDHR